MTDEFHNFLNDISQCFLNRDLKAWRHRVILPFSIITKDGPCVLATDDDLARNFDLYLVACDAMQLDVISRRAITLEDCHDGTWLGTYETRLVSKGLLATAPYTSTSLLQVEAGVLKMSSMLNGRGHYEWTGNAKD